MLGAEHLPELRLDDFTNIVGPEEIAAVREVGEKLKGKSITHINSTSFGGGVAEMLYNLVPLMQDVGMDTHWQVIKGTMEFFKVTKKIHNALQGANIQLTEDEKRIYLEFNKANSEITIMDTDFVMVHDNQPAAIHQFYEPKKGKWIWRCHIDLSTPNMSVWGFLEPFISKYDAAVFSSEKYLIPNLKVPTVMIRPPSINPLSQKNRDMSPSQVLDVLGRYNINPEKPIITQVGRFDPWKDPTGVIDVYRMVKKEVPEIQLLLVASMATDDPEGWLYFEKTARHAGDDSDIHLLTDLKGVKDAEVNALQRASQVALQLSTREGFGLSVAEALWKGVPVVGRNVGGIPLQIVDGSNGFLVEHPNEAAEKTLYLLKHREEAKKMGANGKEHVRRHFLVVQHLKDYLRLFADISSENQVQPSKGALPSEEPSQPTGVV